MPQILIGLGVVLATLVYSAFRRFTLFRSQDKQLNQVRELATDAANSAQADAAAEQAREAYEKSRNDPAGK